MNWSGEIGNGVPIFSIAYAAMNTGCEGLRRRLRFSIAYAAMNEHLYRQTFKH